ncbi:unnamed protein product [Schistosoma intercalatum]|nr:unnamed protein product [Schistosoma intercalatum]CAH8549395.1 unnamed protein product [Schistosoma intercalatum]
MRYECANKSLYESLTSSNANEAVAHDPSSDPEMSNSETYPVVGSNPTVPETCTDSEASSSKEEPLVPENMSHASNNSQEPGAVLSHADYPSDQLSTNKIFKNFDDNAPEDSNSDDFELNGVFPHDPVTLTGFLVPYDVNAVKLIVTSGYEDSTIFRGVGRTWRILKSGYQLRISKKGRC